MILAIRTDKPVAEIYLLDFDGREIDKYHWDADRMLADSLLANIEKIMSKNHISWKDLKSLVAFSGPGSFTGLRIGLTCANTIAYSLNIPIAGSNGENWLKDLDNLSFQKQILPFYGAEPNITKPRK